MANIEEVLAALIPTRRLAIKDLVDASGVDVSPWAVTDNGAAVENPRANPNYCYRWAFGGGDQPSVFCVWHTSLNTRHERIAYDDNLREYALKLESIRYDKREKRSVRSRAVEQASRAREFDLLVQRAFRQKRPVRVVVLKGSTRDPSDLGRATSSVEFRVLDQEPWHVQSYRDETGAFTLVRGLDAAASGSREDGDRKPIYVDQFSAPRPPERIATSGSAFQRSSEVRQKALQRAKGRCELCGALGFSTPDGSVFLETHHVHFLSEGGCDEEWNVIAICPNEHREAHYGAQRESIRTRLVAVLLEKYPSLERHIVPLASG